MATIHRKSAKGVAEIETRAHRLAPRLRSLLILVDGRKSDDELARLMPQADGGLAQLLADGFIEQVVATPTRPPERPAPAAPSGDAAPRAVADLTTLQRLAVRQLTELVGPLGEGLALRIEKARTVEELRPLLATAEQVIANTRGRQAAADFAARLRQP